MTDVTQQTPRLGFQKVGGSQLFEPVDFNRDMDTLDLAVPSLPHVAADFTLGAGVAVSRVDRHGTQKLSLKLTNVLLTLAGSTTSCCASEAIVTWPNSNLNIRGARMNLICVKDGATLLAADTPLVGLGSVAASVSTLATTAIDTVNSVALAGTLSAVAQKNGAATTGDRQIAAGTTNKVFLNTGISTKAGGTLTVSGTVDIFFEDFGTFS